MELAGGRRRQQLFHDFFNYAGLHRSVWLYTTPVSFVEDVTVETGLDGSTGTVRFEVATGGDEVDVAVALRDAEGGEVARARGATGELTVDDVRPWQPGEGYLYDLAIELRDPGGALVDTYSLPVGIRTVRIDGARFLINEAPFYFRGFGKHAIQITNAAGAHPFVVSWAGPVTVRAKTGNTRIADERVSWLLGAVEHQGRDVVFVARRRARADLPNRRAQKSPSAA